MPFKRNQAADVGNIGGHNQRIAFFGKIVERGYVLFRNLQIDRIRPALGLKGGGNLTDGFGIGFGNKAQGFRFAFGAVDAGDFLGIGRIDRSLSLAFGLLDFGFTLTTGKVDLFDFTAFGFGNTGAFFAFGGNLCLHCAKDFLRQPNP